VSRPLFIRGLLRRNGSMKSGSSREERTRHVAVIQVSHCQNKTRPGMRSPDGASKRSGYAGQQKNTRASACFMQNCMESHAFTWYPIYMAVYDVFGGWEMRSRVACTQHMRRFCNTVAVRGPAALSDGSMLRSRCVAGMQRGSATRERNAPTQHASASVTRCAGNVSLPARLLCAETTWAG